MVGDMQYIFYVLRSQDIEHVDMSLSQHYLLEIWKPSIRAPWTGGSIKRSSFIWSFLHYLRLFGNRDYSILTVYYGETMVHYSIVLPTFFRLPFMAKADLNIGPCWTHYEHRRKGIASHVIYKILELYKERERCFWYFTNEKNIGSRRLAEKVGFIPYGKGRRKKRFGIKVLGAFVMEEEYIGDPLLMQKMTLG